MKTSAPVSLRGIAIRLLTLSLILTFTCAGFPPSITTPASAATLHATWVINSDGWKIQVMSLESAELRNERRDIFVAAIELG